MPIQTIKEGAIFIADAHYPHHGDELLTILQQLDSNKLQTPQLFLMGDIFDLLFGYNEYIQTFSKKAIKLLQKLSYKLEIHYIEGNHDFCLKGIFPNIHTYSRKEQPIQFTLGSQKVYLSHGDKYEVGVGYEIYSRAIRHPLTLRVFKIFEKKIINTQIEKLKQKHICKHLKNFELKIQKIQAHYPKDGLVIEGHFHQGIKHNNYISLPSLACQKQIGRVQGNSIVFENI